MSISFSALYTKSRKGRRLTDLGTEGRVEISMSRYGSTISEGFFMIGAIAAFAQDLDNEKATREKALQ
jgi:hypothetical protein